MQMVQEPDGQPIYNIKAVAEATGLPAATLRAWERRYGALAPSRTESGYRLYSARDIATLRWLKARVDEGLSISQAINLLSHRRRPELPQLVERRTEAARGPAEVRDLLVRSLLQFDEPQADQLLSEAFAIYGLEMVSEYVIAPVMVMIGDLWHERKTTTAAEHFATSFLRRKLDAIINAAPHGGSGSLVVLGCAPHDWHEIGVLLIHLMLRRRGLNTIYLGQNVPVDQFVDEMVRLRPAMVIMAATTEETVAGLIDMARAVEQMPAPRPIFAFGGGVFNKRPELRERVPGIFLGESTRSAVGYILELVSGTASLKRLSVG
jgi:DNA-binding transcriptional MerR regulator/methylmalonyl-CoA mutase cobalamin-binding subunit